MNTSTIVKRYGCKIDKADPRDDMFGLARPGLRVPPPPRASTQQWEPPVWNQGDLNSCVGHGVTAATMMARSKAGLETIILSRMFAWYAAREIEGTTDSDVGVSIRDGVKAIAHSGCPPESAWPYDPSRFALPPPADAWTQALSDCVKAYSRLTSLDDYKRCIADGDPFTFGFDVPASFESITTSSTGIMAPIVGEPRLGGHCVVAVAYDDNYHPTFWASPGGIMCRNSWGTNWGWPQSRGHFWMPYDFANSSIRDAWHVTATGYGPSLQH